jgi:hypothetical protein
MPINIGWSAISYVKSLFALIGGSHSQKMNLTFYIALLFFNISSMLFLRTYVA